MFEKFFDFICESKILQVIFIAFVLLIAITLMLFLVPWIAKLFIAIGNFVLPWICKIFSYLKVWFGKYFDFVINL